jgi:hypothetical protein
MHTLSDTPYPSIPTDQTTPSHADLIGKPQSLVMRKVTSNFDRCTKLVCMIDFSSPESQEVFQLQLLRLLGRTFVAIIERRMVPIVNS